MTVQTAAAKTAFRYTDEQWAAVKAERAALREGVKTFEVEGDAQELAFDRLTERFSDLNSLLIIMQRPTTKGFVKAKSAWAAEGLGKIRKGEHGLLIRKPIEGKAAAPADDDDDDTMIVAGRKVKFIWVRVYDRSQMEAFKGQQQARPARREAAKPAAPAAVDPRTSALDDFLS